jgi:alpha,alpha-trehalase
MLTATPVFENLSEIDHRLAGRKPVVFLDYDGTLTEIVQHPQDADLSGVRRAVVEALAKVAPVAVISGRDRRDVAARVGLARLIYAGSHGFDIAGPDGALEFEVGGGYSAVVASAARDLHQRLDPVAGAIIEAKKYSVAVHYRLVQPEDIPAVEQAVQAVLARFSDLTVTPGKKVFELRPRVDWNKGRAVTWLLLALHLEGPEVLPIFIGDDVTDEDAFRAVQARGFGVLVATEPRETVAAYRLRDPAEVEAFLRWLTERLMLN